MTVAAVHRNAAWLFVGRVAGQVVAVAMTVLLAARLGVVGFGQLAFVGAVVFVANVATTFGMISFGAITPQCAPCRARN